MFPNKLKKQIFCISEENMGTALIWACLYFGKFDLALTLEGRFQKDSLYPWCYKYPDWWAKQSTGAAWLCTAGLALSHSVEQMLSHLCRLGVNFTAIEKTSRFCSFGCLGQKDFQTSKDSQKTSMSQQGGGDLFCFLQTGAAGKGFSRCFILVNSNC